MPGFLVPRRAPKSGLSLLAAILAGLFLLSGSADGQAPPGPPESLKTEVTAPKLEAPAADTTPEPTPVIPPAFSIQNSRSAPILNTLGSPPSASEGRINQLDLANQPIMRPGDALEYIPGLLAEDHTGTLKANEYFLRGFFLDHGTDFSIWVDDVPYNMPNHPHLHGYLDFNSVWSELIQYIDFKKGVYYPEAGDFSSAGTARITMMDSTQTGIFKSEVGKDSYFRDLVANSGRLGQGTLLYAVSAEYFNGPWAFPENARLFDGMLRYTVGDEYNGMRWTAWAYSGVGRINDNIPTIAVEAGAINRFGTLDPFEGITTSRDQLNWQWWHKDDAGDVTRANIYYIYYQFRIFTNTSGTAMDDEAGAPGVPDEFEQFEHRHVYGANLSHVIPSRLFGENVRNTFGTQVRFDDIPSLGVNHTVARQLFVPLDNVSIQELNLGFYYQNEIKWGPKVRTVMGFREDFFHWNVDDFLIPENSGSTQAWIPQPKFSLILGPWDRTEFYLNGGLGFHTNDARGIFSHESPDFVLGPAVLTPSQPGSAFARSKGAEIGMKTQAIPNLTASVALWYLHLQSELLFDPFGVTVPGVPTGPTNRYGVELSTTYRLNNWLTFDADYAASRAHFTTVDTQDAVTENGGFDVPQAVGELFTAGPTLRFPNGCFMALQYKYLGPRSLTSDNVISSNATSWFNLGLGCDRERMTVGVNILNLLNSPGHEIDFANTGGVTINGQNFVGGTTGHPLQPFQARFYCTWKF
jgi:hypothetical protein